MAIFMIGTQRSGSNLLRLMINQLPDVAAPHPPHILQRLMPVVAGYGDLKDDARFRTLVDDVCRLVELNPVPWEGVTLDRDAILRRCRQRSLTAVFGAVYDVLAETWGKRDWCCKSLANIQYIPEIEATFDRAKYIYLARDGRDVACSFRKAVVGEKHFYHIAREWTATQEIALTQRERIGPDRFFTISYESLTGDTEGTMKRLCKFLGAEYRDSMLDFHRSDEAKRAAASSELWGNVVNPVMRNNSQKFLTEASEADIRVFESVAGHVLDVLDYERAYVRKGEETRYTADQIAHFDAENARLKREVMAMVDPEDLKRRDQQASLINEIKSRLTARPDSMWINV
jgi:hypothetical protein